MTILKKKWKDYSLFEKAAVGAGAFTVGYALYSFISKSKSNVKKAPVDYGQIPVIYDVNGQQIKWDPNPLAQEIAANFEGYNFKTYPETTDKLLQLQPEQLKLLYNHYNEYFAKDYPTLTALLANEWTDWGDSYEKAVSRLRSLGLNEGNETLNWQRIIEALTNEDKALNFPIKYPAIDLDKSTKQTFLASAGIIAARLIIGATIYAEKRGK